MVQSDARRMAMRLAIMAAEVMLVVALLPSDDGREPMRSGAAAMAFLIAVAAVWRWGALVRRAAARARRRLLPIWFERRMTGRFRLRPRRAGREVEIWAGYQLAAAVSVRPDRDEIVIYPWVELAEGEVDEMGAALGQAILIAARAEAQLADRHVVVGSTSRGAVPPGS
jgi:hypothetical protein